MRYIFTLCLIVLTVLNSFCQSGIKKKLKAGIGISLAIPIYNLSSSITGAGGDALLQYGLTENVNLTADAGFIGLPGKGKFPSTAIVPVRLGVRYFPQSKLYLAGKAGLGIYTILKASANHFAFSASSGYIIANKTDISVYYDGYSNKNTSFGYMGIRAGYNF